MLLDALTWALTAAIAAVLGAVVDARSAQLPFLHVAWVAAATLSGAAGIGVFFCRRASQHAQTNPMDVQKLHEARLHSAPMDAPCDAHASTDIPDMDVRRERLRQLNNELDVSSSTVSHDLGVPVEVIGGFTDALPRGEVGQVDAEARSDLERIRRYVCRMEELIADLLALSRLSTSTPRHIRFELGELAREVIAVQERYPDRRVEWQAPWDFCMVAGIGLATVARIARLHGGSVHARPREGGGSMFKVRVPVLRIDGTGREEARQTSC